MEAEKDYPGMVQVALPVYELIIKGSGPRDVTVLAYWFHKYKHYTLDAMSQIISAYERYFSLNADQQANLEDAQEIYAREDLGRCEHYFVYNI